MGIELKYSLLEAMTGKRLDITIKETGAGGIYLAAKSAFLADHSSIIANNFNTLDVSSNTDRGEYSLPIIAIQSSANSLAFRDSILQAIYVNDLTSFSDEYKGINLTSVPMVNERTLFQPSQYIFNASFELQELKAIHTEGFNRKAVSVEGAYGIANLPRVTDKNQNLSSAQFIPTHQNQQNTLSSSRNSLSVSINIDQDTASSKFMEFQNRSMIETAKSLGLTPGSGKLRSIAELQQRLSLASKLSASSQPLAPIRQAQAS